MLRINIKNVHIEGSTIIAISSILAVLVLSVAFVALS